MDGGAQIYIALTLLPIVLAIIITVNLVRLPGFFKALQDEQRKTNELLAQLLGKPPTQG